MGTVGATFYLIGVGFLFQMTGTLNMADMAVRLEPPGTVTARAPDDHGARRVRVPDRRG